MKPHIRIALLFGLSVLSGCVSLPRKPPPPELVNTAVPEGFAPNIRMLTVNRQRYLRELPQSVEGLKRAAHGGPVNILALSGGGSNAAFGAGALIGLSRAHTRPQFQMVTGVSAGALLAPFAFLGPSWDPQLRKVFTDGDIEALQHSVVFGTLDRVLFPEGLKGRGPLAALVDRSISNAMIKAVGRAAATGRMLIVATTDLDDQETMLWNLGAIAERGDPAAYKLFRKILTASASVPGVFPPVMIRVHESGKVYEEMQVDGSVTTPLFVAPLIAATTPGTGSQLAGANVYVIVDGHLGTPPVETPVDTLKVLESSFSAQLTSGTRNALVGIIALARLNHMNFQFTDMPLNYSSGGFLDFHHKHLQRLFDYGMRCAEQGLLWTSTAEAVQRDVYPHPRDTMAQTACPAAEAPPHSKVDRQILALKRALRQPETFVAGSR